VVRHQIWAVHGWTALPWLRGLDQPTVVLAGDDDPVANEHILARLIPRARLVVIRGGGHPFLLQLAPSMAAPVADFLTDQRARP
jgi:pimeloyl-ACP methyl ester carboxylesterase